jgi:uncharacterized protein YaaR (DUF327 family)
MGSPKLRFYKTNIKSFITDISFATVDLRTSKKLSTHVEEIEFENINIILEQILVLVLQIMLELTLLFVRM